MFEAKDEAAKVPTDLDHHLPVPVGDGGYTSP